MTLTHDLSPAMRRELAEGRTGPLPIVVLLRFGPAGLLAFQTDFEWKLHPEC